MTTFADSNAWTITSKGVFGKARDSSYKEKVREGVPIEYFFEIEHHKIYRDWETDRKSTRLNSSHRL